MTSAKKPDPYALDAAGAARGPGGPAGGAGSGFTTAVHDGVHVLTLSRSEVLDAYEIEQMSESLRRYVDGLDTPRVVIDLGPVQHLSSAALGMLISTRTAVSGKGGGLCLANVKGDLMEVFRITNLHKLLMIHKSTEAAVESLR